MIVRSYHLTPPEFHEWTPEFLEVAGRVKTVLLDSIGGIRVEHVGSTSVRDCGGKGIVDLLVLYPEGDLNRVRKLVDGLGFQKQKGGHPFPEERPMRVGAVEHGGRLFKIHLHVLYEESEEAKSLCAFRDDLAGDDEKRLAYLHLKRQILMEEGMDPVEYTERKASFFRGVSD